MIITLSGAQGQGKTTILEIMEKEGYQVEYNTTARDILKEWDVSLDYIYGDAEMAMKFQDEILDRQEKINKVYSHITKTPTASTHDIVLMERSYADIFTYAMFAVGSLNHCSAWLNGYYARCMELQKFYKKVIFLTGRNYTPESDGVRSTNKLYGNSVDLIIEHNVKEMVGNTRDQIRFVSFDRFDDRGNAVHEIIKETSSTGILMNSLHGVGSNE